MFSLEEQVKKDKSDYKKANNVFTKFLQDINKEKFGFEKSVDELDSTIYLVETKKGKFKIQMISFYTDLYFHDIEIVDNSTSLEIVGINLGGSFEEVSIFCVEFEYGNESYYFDSAEEYDEQVWRLYHTDTFYKVWSNCKEIIKEYLEIDLDVLYGDD
jgi:hypothetical protein